MKIYTLIDNKGNIDSVQYKKELISKKKGYKIYEIDITKKEKQYIEKQLDSGNWNKIELLIKKKRRIE